MTFKCCSQLKSQKGMNPQVRSIDSKAQLPNLQSASDLPINLSKSLNNLVQLRDPLKLDSKSKLSKLID